MGVLGSDDSIDCMCVTRAGKLEPAWVDERTAEFIFRHSAEAVEWLVKMRRAVFHLILKAPLGFAPDSEGGHAVRRIACR